MDGSTGVVAFVDESFLEAGNDGFYILAATVVDAHHHEVVRSVMLALRGRRRWPKLHWSEMDTRQRAVAVTAVAGIDGIHVVAVGAPVPRRRQERARALCLSHLVIELGGLGVTEMVLESRTAQLDLRDIRTVRGARFALAAGSRVHASHMGGAEEPLLWAADIVAGAIRAHRQGDGRFRRVLEGHLHEIDLDTGLDSRG